MSPAMRRGAAFSGLLHAAVVAALLAGLPLRTPQDQPPVSDVEFDFLSDQPRQVAKAAQQAPEPAAAVAGVATPAPPAPPPPMPAARALPPPPVPSTATPAARPVPPPPIPPPPVQPRDVTATPTPPVPVKAPSPPLPTPPRQLASPPAPSQTSQPNAAKNAPLDTHSVESTLDRLRSAERQAQAAKAVPVSGGVPRPGGSPNGDITAKLSGEQKGAISDKVRECWTKDAGALDLARMSVIMTVTLDAAGIVREAVVGDADRGKLADPRFRAFAERAERANRDSRCADLGQLLPKSEAGHVVKLTFRFRP